MTTDPFALALKRLRTNAGLSQSELSRRMRVSPSLVSRWEHDTRLPSRKAVTRIADALNLTEIDRLLLVTAAFMPHEVTAQVAAAIRAEFV